MGTTGLSITLANSIIGVGILAMPFCFQQCGVLLATVILLSMGLMSRLCCYFLLKSAILARRRNFEYLAFHVFGPVGKLAVEIGIIGFLMGTCIAYFVVVGDLGPQIISKIFNINQSDILRTSIMVIVSLVCVLPLGLLRNVDSLSNVSAATIGFYFCLVIKVIAEAATQLPSGQWHNLEMWKPSGVLQCMPIFSMALFCQTQLFEIFESLPSLSLEKMNVVTKNAINICTCVYFTLGLFGFIAFSQQEISGNILMSLSPTMASDVIKLGFVMSLAFSFPLIIFPCRASLYSLLYKKVHSSQHDHIINHSIPETTFRCITVGIVAVSLFISLLIPNIELVLGLVGSTIGVIICVLFPAACFVNLTFKNTNERVLAKGVLVFGLIIMVLGTYANLQAAENKIDKYDERYITQERIDKIVEDFFEKRGKNEDILKSVKNINSDNNNNMLRDSEVQPPNPVPPESHSNEVKSPEPAKENKIKNDNLLNDVLLPEKLKEEAADRNDRVSESHPKNLKGKLNDAKLANEDSPVNVEEKQKLPSNEEIKNEKINILKQQQLIETMKQHGEEQKELLQEQKEILDEIIKNKNEEKIEKEANIEKAKEEESNKQQQLIETIKQHGEEQKELMKEQKEILNEIIKTKKELQQNKEAENNEAKKIAVESIKQIANIAIQSIGGATDKPIVKENEDKKADILEKLTNEAVQEIAKKAVETIEAIQEIKEEPKVVEEVKVDNKHDNEVIQNNNNLNAAPIENIAPLQNIAKLNPPQKHEEKQETQNDVKIQENKETDKQIDINVPVENIVQELKTHSHSPDEPQSYKVGEDTEAKQNENKLNKNLPIPLAMNGLKVQNGVIQNTRENPVVNDLKMENAKEKQEPIQRQKREVVDCTNKQIDERDRKICDSLVIPKLSDKNVPKINVIDKSSILPKLDIHEKPEILPKVDLNDELSRLPIDPIHISRSLKSFKEER